MNLIEEYVSYLSTQKRYSVRTVSTYSTVLEQFVRFTCNNETETYHVADAENDVLISAMNAPHVRNYQVYLLEKMKDDPRTVNLHLSVLSGFSKYLIRKGAIKANPVSLVVRPKQNKRLPVFYKQDSMDKYLSMDNVLSRRDFELELSTEKERRDTYALCLGRIIICLLYSTGIRRAELISLRRRDFDRSRAKIHVLGKGDKMREIPLTDTLIEELSLYLQSVSSLVKDASSAPDAPLLVTYAGGALYPVLVDKAVKSELGAMGRDFSGRKSPHVLRHTFATGLLSEGADLNSIKEVLGHSNLAATQVYTHSSVAAMKKIYQTAHPRAGKERNKDGKDNG